MQFKKITCDVCGQKILGTDIEIKNHLISHEYEWIQTLKDKYRV